MAARRQHPETGVPESINLDKAEPLQWATPAAEMELVRARADAAAAESELQRLRQQLGVEARSVTTDHPVQSSNLAPDQSIPTRTRESPLRHQRYNTSPSVALLEADMREHEVTLAAREQQVRFERDLEARDQATVVDGLEKLVHEHKIANQRAQRSLGILEDENVRFIEAKEAAEQDRDSMRAELLQLRERAREQERHFLEVIRDKELKYDTLERRCSRLTTELSDSRATEAESAAEARRKSELHARAAEKIAELTDERNVERSRGNRIDGQLEATKKKCSDMTDRLAAAIQTIELYRQHQLRLLELTANLFLVGVNTKRHALDCAARGYFATRSRKVYDQVQEVYNELVDLAVTMDRGQDRTRVLNQLERLQRAEKKKM